VWSAGRERQWSGGRLPGVVVGSSRCWEVIHGGAVLVVWSTRPKRGWSGLSVAVHIERGGATVRGRRGCWGWSWKGCRGAPVWGGAQGGDSQTEGGRRRRRSVDQGAAVSVSMVRAEAEAVHEQNKRMRRESSSAGRSPYSRTRRWLRQRKRWAVNTVGGEAAAAVSWVRARRWRPLSDGVSTVRMRSAHGSDRAADRWAAAVSLLSPNYPNWFKLGNSKRMPYLGPKIPKFLMPLDGGIMNNSLNFEDIQFSIEL
jgi:hypothetical protein